MVGKKAEPVSVEDAKARLREAAEGSGLAKWVKAHPAEAVIGAFLLGFVAGTSPRARDALRDAALSLLLKS